MCVCILRIMCVLCVEYVVANEKKLFTLLDLCVSSLRRGHANLLCIVPILTDDPRRESREVGVGFPRTAGRQRIGVQCGPAQLECVHVHAHARAHAHAHAHLINKEKHHPCQA